MQYLFLELFMNNHLKIFDESKSDEMMTRRVL